jgi:glutamate N-acetyltransferase/amino-acid N-acetyltransferase
MQTIANGICAPKGFLASGVAANIKGNNADKKDVALVFSIKPASAAGVFTTNVAKAAPVKVSRAKVAHGTLSALVINSGNANACTGVQGVADANHMCDVAAASLNLESTQVAVASTGIIGVPLPMNRIVSGIRDSAKALAPHGNLDAAKAIMTTDTFMKEIAVNFNIGGSLVTMGAMAKGSGMIHPNMATTLAFVTTDANIAPATLQTALSHAVDKSFNAISVDGDTSTNDMIIALANGQAENQIIEANTHEYGQFYLALEQVLIHLAKEVAKDGEGATKLLEMQVYGANSQKDAQAAAKAVCASPLVKTALFASDGNWGRIVCAMGYSGANFDVDQIDLFIGNQQVVKKGKGIVFSEEAVTHELSQKEVSVRAYLHQGDFSAVAWGCDLSHDYITINAGYRC